MSFLDLPNEIIVEIFMFLKLTDLGNCAKICKRFKNIFNDEILWFRINKSQKKIPNVFLKQISQNGQNLKVTLIIGRYFNSVAP